MKRPQDLIRTITLSALLAIASAQADEAAPDVELIRIAHETREIEGWTVHVDKSLLAGKDRETGKLALRILGQRLHEIALKLPEEPVADMRKVPIFIDNKHPMGNAHYHPGKDWLVDGENDHIARMATISCELYQAFEHFHWVGFYRKVDATTLKVALTRAAMAA